MANQLTLNSISLEELKAKAAALPKFVDTTDATASQDHIVDGKTAYVNGTKIKGTNPYEKTTTDAQVSEIGELVAELSAALDGKSVGGGAAVETCTVKRNSVNAFIGYTDENGVAQILDNSSSTLTIQCMKNALVCAYDSQHISGVYATGGEILFEDTIMHTVVFVRAISDINVTI